MSGRGSAQRLERNAAGRQVPVRVNGEPAIPFAGVGKHKPSGRRAAPPLATAADHPADGNKLVPTLKAALKKVGLKNGMTVTTHHHFRNGDLVANRLFDAAAELGVKNLRWAPSASFPCHAPIIRHLDAGVVHHIEGSMNGPLGDYTSEGKMRGMAVLRSHGGRYQAIQDGELHVDVAVIAAPTADPFGNANGLHGPSACGGLGFAVADAEYADRVVVVTDNLVPFPCVPWQINGNRVDAVVEMEKIGDPSQIVSGTTQITRSPDRLLIAELTAKFIAASGILKNGFSFQAGAGGTALAFAIYLKEMMKERGIRARFIRGGSTKYLVEMLEEGLTDYILDGQTFDLAGVRSMGENPRHVNTTPFTSYNYHGKGMFATMVDAVVLGATEVDVAFNANVVTHSDGRLLHGIGGWQNCLFSGCTILAVPSFRDRIPVVVDEVTTLCGPSELIDVIVTERGIAINPRRKDLRRAVRGSGLPVRPIEEIREEVDRLVGGSPAKARTGRKVVAAIKWVDGTVIDCVRQVL
ncbi:MAG: citrate lyase subunit alpha [Candidatus Eisenbacteria bacterium]|nr:citrate lyase subunit alpha [Candidatus Latescibacterota bacterium]MBD3302110.1 citrate lyase subunit alpha [Candidatus Eisenbacteria bacterium]